MDEVRVLKHLHDPSQILWFDTTEAGIIVIFYVLAMLFDGIAWVLLLVGPYWFISEKRSGNRGYVTQFLYYLGLKQLKGYPNASANVFSE